MFGSFVYTSFPDIVLTLDWRSYSFTFFTFNFVKFTHLHTLHLTCDGLVDLDPTDGIETALNDRCFTAVLGAMTRFLRGIGTTTRLKSLTIAFTWSHQLSEFVRYKVMLNVPWRGFDAVLSENPLVDVPNIFLSLRLPITIEVSEGLEDFYEDVVRKSLPKLAASGRLQFEMIEY